MDWEEALTLIAQLASRTGMWRDWLMAHRRRPRFVVAKHTGCVDDGSDEQCRTNFKNWETFNFCLGSSSLLRRGYHVSLGLNPNNNIHSKRWRSKLTPTTPAITTSNTQNPNHHHQPTKQLILTFLINNDTIVSSFLAVIDLHLLLIRRPCRKRSPFPARLTRPLVRLSNSFWTLTGKLYARVGSSAQRNSVDLRSTATMSRLWLHSWTNVIWWVSLDACFWVSGSSLSIVAVDNMIDFFCSCTIRGWYSQWSQLLLSTTEWTSWSGRVQSRTQCRSPYDPRFAQMAQQGLLHQLVLVLHFNFNFLHHQLLYCSSTFR